MNKQVADAKIFGIQGFCKDLLEVADVLNKAISTVPPDALEQSQHLKDMHEGLVLTETQILKVFAKHGLVQENPLGQKFDPNKHDALFQIPAPDKEPNTVLDVQKIGYILQGRTIRPAAVGVSKQWSIYGRFGDQNYLRGDWESIHIQQYGRFTWPVIIKFYWVPIEICVLNLL